MKVITHTITHTAKLAGRQIESIMYPANFALIFFCLLFFHQGKKRRNKREESNR